MVKNLLQCLKLTKQQIRELFFTIVIPVAAGISIVAVIKPSIIVEANVLNICLISAVAVLPMWLLNNVVWSTIILSFFQQAVKIIVSVMNVSQDAKSGFSEILDWLFDNIRFQAMYDFTFRHISSVITAAGYYVTALVLYLIQPPKVASFLIFMAICLIPAICYLLLCRFIFGAIKSHFAKMSTPDIMEWFIRSFIQEPNKKREMLDFIDQKRKETLLQVRTNWAKRLNSDGLTPAD